MSHRPHGFDVARRSAEQLARFGAHCRHAFLTGGRLFLERHDGRLVQHDAAVVGIDKGIGRAEVHRHGMTEQSIEKRVMRRRSGHRKALMCRYPPLPGSLENAPPVTRAAGPAQMGVARSARRG